MPEAITKYAINSTLGTDEFQPLDKIIKGQRHFASSDVTIAILGDAGSFGFLPKSFTPKTSGVVKLIGDISGSVGEMRIFEDGNLYKTIASAQMPYEISIKKNAVYTFQADNGTGIDNLKIGAQIVDGSLFEIENIE